MTNFENASPQVVMFGADDQSVRSLPVKAIDIPTHCPKFYSFFEKGPSGPQLVDGGDLMEMYGVGSFDTESKFFNPAMKYMEGILGKGNPIVVERLVPSNVTTKANTTIYLDVVKDMIKKYKRTDAGVIVKDSTGAKVEDTDSPIEGYRIKVIQEVNTDPLTTGLGTRQSKTGYMTALDGTKSTMIPIMEFNASYLGGTYNKYGFGINLKKNNELGSTFLDKTKSLPFEVYLYEKDINGSPTIVKDLFGATKNTFVFKSGVKNPNTTAVMDATTMLDNYSNLTNLTLNKRLPVIDTPYIYSDNLDDLLGKLYETEKPYINAMMTVNDGSIVNTSSWFDFISDDDADNNKYLINPFNAYSTNRIFYFSIALDQETVTYAPKHSEVYMVANLPIFLSGGTDGDTSFDSLQDRIEAKMGDYIDENSPVMDLAVNVENVMYDAGYRMSTKLALINFIVKRKDTLVVLSPYTYGSKVGLSLSEQRSLGILLKVRLQLAPESVYFGTPVARGMIVMGFGKITGSISKANYPQTYDIAIKSASMMGGTTWKSEKLFARGETNIIKSMYDLYPNEIPQGIKPALWDSGLVWSQPYDIKRFYFPALQTVYDNDTSVLNNYFNAMALTIINKVASRIWRAYTGSVEYSPAELIDHAENMANNELRDVFAGVVTVVPKAMITSFDEAAGYTWTMVFKMGGKVSKTVMLSYIVALREEDLK